MKSIKTSKAFKNCSHNIIHLKFPNGNALSTIWGYGTYSDNHDYKDSSILFDPIAPFKTFMESDTAEIMIINASDKLVKRIHKKYDGDGSVIGYLTMTQWLEIVKLLSK